MVLQECPAWMLLAECVGTDGVVRTPGGREGSEPGDCTERRSNARHEWTLKKESQCSRCRKGTPCRKSPRTKLVKCLAALRREDECRERQSVDDAHHCTDQCAGGDQTAGYRGAQTGLNAGDEIELKHHSGDEAECRPRNRR